MTAESPDPTSDPASDPGQSPDPHLDPKPEFSRPTAGLLGCLAGFALGSFAGVVATLVKMVARVPTTLISEAAFIVVYALSPIGAFVCWRIGLRMWDRRYGGGPR